MIDGARAVYILDETGRSGPDNMAVDAALLERAARDGSLYLRLYRWAPHCLSFGRHEPATRRYDRTRIEQLGLDTVRRPTGGRAVWHATELTYAIAAPERWFGSLKDTYLAIHAMLTGALARLGVGARLAAPAAPLAPDAGACFAAPVGGEVTVGDRKLVGSAQVREQGAFLQHGSLLLENAQDMVSRVSRGSPAPPRATSLSDCLGRSVSWEEAADAIIHEAIAAWPAAWVEGSMAPPAALRTRFADRGWTWRR